MIHSLYNLFVFKQKRKNSFYIDKKKIVYVLRRARLRIHELILAKSQPLKNDLQPLRSDFFLEIFIVVTVYTVNYS